MAQIVNLHLQKSDVECRIPQWMSDSESIEWLATYRWYHARKAYAPKQNFSGEWSKVF